jgi:hypothetical protein
MAEFMITSPSGEKYKVTAPEGASQSDVMERVKQAQGKASEANKPSGFLDFFKSIPHGIVKGFAGAASASGQAAQAEMSEEITTPGPEFTTSALGGDALHKPQTRAGRFGETVGEFAGNPASWIGPGGPVAKGVGAVASAVGSEAAGQVTEGTGLEPWARLGGAVAGGQLPAAALHVASPLAVTAGRAATRDVLRGEGIEPTAGEITGSKALRYGEHHLGDAPGSGGAFTRVKDTELHQFTGAVIERMGEHADAATPEVINRARDRIGAVLENVAARLPINRDRQFDQDLTQISTDLTTERLPPDSVNRIMAQVENLWAGFMPDARGRAVMDGRAYQAATRHGTPLQRAIDDPDPNISYYATRVRSALDDAMERTATGRGTRPGVGRQQALEDLREARREWYNMLVISRAAASAGESAAEGLVTPQKLRQLLTSSDDKKIQYAAGRGDLNELAHAGTEMMSPLPNSGTAQRNLLTDIPARIGAAVGGAATQAAHGEPISGALAGSMAPGLAGRALMSPLMQDYLKGDLPAQAQARAVLDALPPGGVTALRSGADSALTAAPDQKRDPRHLSDAELRGLLGL